MVAPRRLGECQDRRKCVEAPWRKAIRLGLALRRRLASILEIAGRVFAAEEKQIMACWTNRVAVVALLLCSCSAAWGGGAR